MKLFSFTRMGMYNCDPNWWDYNLSLFAAITLPSMSQAIHNPDDFWVLLVNKISPLEAVRRLNTLIRNSPIRGNTYVLYEDYTSYWQEQSKIHSDFVKQHIEHGEFFIKHQIDSDDAVSYDMFDIARQFVNEKIKELGEDTKFVFTIKKLYNFYIRENKLLGENRPFGSFNGFSYDNDCDRFPWIHQMRFMPYKDDTFYKKNNYLVFEHETNREMALYILHRASDYDINESMFNRQRKVDKQAGVISQSLLEFGVTQTAIDNLLAKYPEPLAYYESRHSYKEPFKSSIDFYRSKLAELYRLTKQSLDYLDIEKRDLRERIAKIMNSSHACTWLSALAQFYEIGFSPNNIYTKIQDGLEYLESLGESDHTYAIAYKGDICFTLYSIKAEIVSKKDTSLCRILFSPSQRGNQNVWIKSIIENGTPITSIEVMGLEYSMNIDGLNIVVLDGITVKDSVNINPKKNFKLTR